MLNVTDILGPSCRRKYHANCISNWMMKQLEDAAVMNPTCDLFTEHPIRKECMVCNRPRVDHYFDPGSINVIRTALDLEVTTPIAAFMNSEYLWIPNNCTIENITEFFGYLPQKKVPLLGKSGEKFRQRQYEVQMPYTDLFSEQCKFSNAEKKNMLERFIVARNQNNIDEAYVKMLEEEMPSECAKCGLNLERGQMVIRGTKDDSERVWHPACFVCIRCGELPVDLIHCIDETGRIFCIRHFGEQYRPRCIACYELIFDENFTVALDKHWHTEHFCCYGCDKPLAGVRHFSKHNRPFCLTCYEDKFRFICKKCEVKINALDDDYTCAGEHWHGPCFVCENCSGSLIDTQICRHNEKIYCADCYYEHHAERCEKCGDHFRVRNLKLEYEGQLWHSDCFTCSDCSQPIQYQKFVHVDDKIYCITCYRANYAFTCKNCEKPIVKSGIIYGNQHYHKDCFICDTCKKPLEKKLLTKDDKHYCEICYIENFSHMCFACKKVILGPVKICKFEDKTWHKHCFSCTKCQKSLSGQEFSISGDELLCVQCCM